jgi:hypothetical protein
MKPGALFVGACLVVAVLPVLVRADPTPGPHASSTAGVHAGFEAARDIAAQALVTTHLRDRPLTQQPLTALEARFAANFPGAIARYRAGDATLIVRHVTQPTRQLHPAADCFRAAGYSLGAVRTHADNRQTRWSCFEASQGGRRWRVCERITNASGRQWTDVSSWYWSALWSQRMSGESASAGPWWAITLVAPIDSEDNS